MAAPGTCHFSGPGEQKPMQAHAIGVATVSTTAANLDLHHGRSMIPGSVVEHSQHGHNAIGVAIGAPDVAACGPNVVHGQPDAASTL